MHIALCLPCWLVNRSVGVTINLLLRLSFFKPDSPYSSDLPDSSNSQSFNNNKTTRIAKDHPKGPASCKWSIEGADLLLIIIRRGRLLANDHPKEQASCKRTSQGSSLLQMIIRRDRSDLIHNIHLVCLIHPIHNHSTTTTIAIHHPKGQASCKWSSEGTGLLKMIIGTDLKFVKHFTRPDFWAKNFTHQKTRELRLFCQQ